jgi:hypothetical protein
VMFDGATSTTHIEIDGHPVKMHAVDNFVARAMHPSPRVNVHFVSPAIAIDTKHDQRDVNHTLVVSRNKSTKRSKPC